MSTASAAIALPFQEAIAFFKGKVPEHSQHWTDVWRTAHTRSFMVAGAASDALLADFQASIRKALEQGTTLADFRKDFDAIVARHGWVHNGHPAWRSRVIYETNLSMAYSAGRYAQLTEPETKQLYPFWQYVHSGSSHPRLQHLGWNGLTLSCDDPWWAAHYPPNGWHCGCRVRPVSRGGLQRMGKDGPDTPPPAQTRQWINPRTGEIHQVPIGIDPGFDYNPGQAWKEQAADPPPSAGATTRVRPPAPHHPSAAFDPLPTADLQHAAAVLKEATDDFAATMTQAESDALYTWKGYPGYDMNRVLRGIAPELAPGLMPTINTLQSLLRRAVAPRDLAVRRGMSAGEAARYGKPGSRLKNETFMATSLSDAVGSEFAGVAGEGAVIAEVRIRKGTRGVMYVHPYPAPLFNQWEVLVNAGAVFVVIENEGGRLVLEVESADDTVE